jgi:phosphate-selective porin
VSKLRETLANYPDPDSARRPSRASTGIRLQIRARSAASTASPSGTALPAAPGFMEGASTTITISGVALADTATNSSPFDVTGALAAGYYIIGTTHPGRPDPHHHRGGYAQIPANFGRAAGQRVHRDHGQLHFNGSAGNAVVPSA